MVFVGSSGLGKTEYAKSIHGREKTFYCNCQGLSEPGLKGFDRRKHTAVCLDEVDPWLVINNKVLFETTIDGAWLAQSKCGQHQYWKWLFMVPIIICTNDWILARRRRAQYARRRSRLGQPEEVSQRWR